MSQSSFISILVAEDNDISREIIKDLLVAQGYNVLTAVDGGSAIDVIKEKDVDLAFVDIKMAPQGGFEFVKYLRINKIDIPVVIITSDRSSDMLSTANSLGVQQVMHKPVEPKRLNEVVVRILKGRNINPKPFAVGVEKKPASPEEFMQMTFVMAQKNVRDSRGGPYASIVVDDQSKIIGKGTNGRASRFDPLAHSEVMAIRQAVEALTNSDLSHCTLYSSSEPTEVGKALIRSVGIPKVYIGLTHEEISQISKKKDKDNVSAKNPRDPEVLKLEIPELAELFKS